jgi:hypothetical protein
MCYCFKWLLFSFFTVENNGRFVLTLAAADPIRFSFKQELAFLYFSESEG